MTDTLTLDPQTTALVLIDLQRGIVQMPVGPHAATDVVARGAKLAAAFRAAHATVVLVRVSFSADGADVLGQPRDFPMTMKRPPGWDELLPELGATPSDIVVTKHQWGAFYGTELDLQLRRRGVDTIVIGGISTNFGVESTARDAFERGYSLVFVENAMAAVSAEAHAFACGTIFPRLGRVRSAEDVLAALAQLLSMTPDPHAALRQTVQATTLDGPGLTESALRHAAADGRDVPADLRTFVEKIHAHAYRVTDEDVAAVQATYGDDRTFEVIVSAALGASERRLAAGLRALEDA